MKYRVEVYKRISLYYEVDAAGPAEAVAAAEELHEETGPVGLCHQCTGGGMFHPWDVDDSDEWDWRPGSVDVEELK